MRLLWTKLSRWKVGESYFLLYCLFFMANIVLSETSPTSNDASCPSTCTCVISTKVVNCSDKNLRDIPQGLPAWTRQLLLRNNRFSSDIISRYDFSKLRDLEQLDLSGNKVVSLDVDWTGLHKLSKISLDHCSLSTLPIIKMTPNLTHLYLSHNSISNISNSLGQLSTLQVLDLSFNKLKQISKDSFKSQTQLKHLHLQKNRITTLSWDSFAGLNKTETLDLSRNKIKNIKSSSPQSANKQEICSGNLQSLKHLNLSQNQLTHVGGLTFSGMCSLLTLQIDRNKISHLSDGAFYGPTALRTLILDHNLISSVKRGWLFQLSSLQTLSVAFNNLTRIEGDAWNFCKELLHLDLSHNHLTSLASHGFSELNKLETLQLGTNRIAFLEDFAFDGLSQLKTLNLSNNEISSSIEDIDGAFLGLNSIEYLSLRNNRIRSLSSSALEGVENVMTLDLCQNDVTSIQNQTFEKMTNLKTLSIVSSSFLCDCQLAWFPKWLYAMDKLRDDFSYTVEGRCFHPPKLEGRDILKIADEEFICVDHPIPILLQEPTERTALIGDNITFECSASATYSNMINETKELSTIIPLHGLPPKMGNSVPENPLVDTKIPQPQNPQFMLDGVLEPPLATIDDPDKLGESSLKAGESRASRSGGFPLKADEPPKESEKRTPPQRRDTGQLFNADKNGMTVTWKRGQEIIHPGSGIEISNVTRQQGGYVYVTSHLVLKGVTSDDNGNYNCIVSNTYGHTRSKPVELVVNEYPRFTKTPTNVTVVMNGSSVLIDCAATGQPSPLIQWQKDGGKDFPAAKQRRLRREQSSHPKPDMDEESADEDESGLERKSGGGMMLIPGESGKKGIDDDKNEKFTVDTDAPLDFALVLPEDAGEYECVVESSVGKIIAKAMLVVEMPPSFSKPLSSEARAFAGENAVIECFTDGKPVPEISWQFKGKPLNFTSRHHVAEKNQMIVITDVQSTDAGIYTCDVSNKHGRIQHSVQLQIAEANSGSDFISALLDGYNPIWFASIIVCVAVVIFVLTWVCCRIRYKNREKKKALSTNTDETDLEPGAQLDANSFTSTDESIRKGQSAHSIPHITGETGFRSNGRYDSSPHQASVSMSDISHMQITQTPGGQSTTPLLAPNGFIHRQPKRSLSSMAIRKENIPISRFHSAENFRIEGLETQTTGRQKNSPAPLPLVSPSAVYAKKAAGEDNYIPVVLKAQKSCQSTAAPSGMTELKKSKNGYVAPPNGGTNSQKMKKPKKVKSRIQGQPNNKEQTSERLDSKKSKQKPRAMGNGKVPMGNGKVPMGNGKVPMGNGKVPAHPSNKLSKGVAGTCPSVEQNNTQFHKRQCDKRNNFAKSQNHDSALHNHPHKDRRKPTEDCYHMDSILPPDGSAESSQRLLRSSDSYLKPTIDKNDTDFSSETTLASDSSSLLHHNNVTSQMHNYQMPPSGCVSDRLLS